MPSPRETEADVLARELYQAQCQLYETGRALHDRAGPLLSAAGIRLQLLRMDQPDTAETVEETLAMLDQVTESIRALSQKLDGSPASHIGLERALVRLAEERDAPVELSYTAGVSLPAVPAAVVYDTITRALERAGEAAVRLSVRGAGQRLAVRMVWKGRARWSRGEVTALARRLRPAGVVLDVTTKESTIVSIRYATRSTARR
jgi:hypothetical protein